MISVWSMKAAGKEIALRSTDCSDLCVPVNPAIGERTSDIKNPAFRKVGNRLSGTPEIIVARPIILMFEADVLHRKPNYS
jgi:hypothetical protein